MTRATVRSPYTDPLRAAELLADLPRPSERPRITPADRMRAAAENAHSSALWGEGRVGDLRRHEEGSEEYLDRLARALERAGYVVHAPGAELCVPYSEHAAYIRRLEGELDAAVAQAQDTATALAEMAAAQEATGTPVAPQAPVQPRERRPVPMPTAGSRAARLLQTFAEHAPLFGQEGMTAAEATAAAGLPEGAWKRVSDLATLGLIGPRVTNTEATLDGVQLTRKRPGDRLPARVWLISPAGRAHHAALAAQS